MTNPFSLQFSGGYFLRRAQWVVQAGQEVAFFMVADFENFVNFVAYDSRMRVYFQLEPWGNSL
jgi:hypothetical protein